MISDEIERKLDELEELQKQMGIDLENIAKDLQDISARLDALEEEIGYVK